MKVNIDLPKMEKIKSNHSINHPICQPQRHYYKVWYVNNKTGLIEYACFLDGLEAKEFLEIESKSK
jgi:hypothetical protein